MYSVWHLLNVNSRISIGNVYVQLNRNDIAYKINRCIFLVEWNGIISVLGHCIEDLLNKGQLENPSNRKEIVLLPSTIGRTENLVYMFIIL